MNGWSPLVADGQAAKAMKPGERPFDDPPGPAETAAVWRPAFRQGRRDPPVVQGIAVRLRIVSAITLNEVRFAEGPPDEAADRRNRVDERQ